MKITAVYFSATGTTQKGVRAIAGAFGCPCEEIDVTSGRTFDTDLSDSDLVIFGTPCYSGRMPIIAKERISRFKGSDTPCIAVITYGNRDFDDAVLEMCDMAADNGFIPFAAAALVGQHTFGEIAVGRPDADDLSQDREFGKRALVKFCEDIKDIRPRIPGNHPYRDGGKGGSFRPQTLPSCVGCGLCASQCPAGAIGDDFKTIDNEKCISCFRCIMVCPMNAKVMDTPEYREFAEGFSKKLAEPRENQYFL